MAAINIREIRSMNHCAYCGEVEGLQRDHVIPTSYLRQKRRYEGDWLVPACSECNRTLGSELIFNVPDRALWVMTAYQRKYRKLIRAIPWDEEEIAELGHNLKLLILAQEKAAREIRRRIEYLRMVACQPITYLAALRPTIDPEIEDVPEFVDEDLQAKRIRRSLLISKARLKYRHAEMD